MQRFSEEQPRFDDATQRQVLSLAAELQRYGREGATLAELEAKAKEAGIDPVYLNMALGHVIAPATPPVSEAAPREEKAWYQNNEITLIAVLVFTAMQVFSVVQMMQAGGKSFPVALLFAPILGLAFSRTTSHRFGAIAALIGSTLSTVILTLIVHRLGMTGNTLSHAWAKDVIAVGMIEFVALLIGFALAAVGRWVWSRMKRA